MDGFINSLTEKQIKKMLNYWRGYSFQCVRNKTIVTMLVYLNITPLELVGIKDSNIPIIIAPTFKRQLNKYKRIRRIYFDSEQQFKYFFLDDDKKPMSEKAIINILHSALRFANVNPDKL